MNMKVLKTQLLYAVRKVLDVSKTNMAVQCIGMTNSDNKREERESVCVCVCV